MCGSRATFLMNILKTYSLLGGGCRKGSPPDYPSKCVRSDEAGCYHNNFLLAVVTDAGKRFGLTVTQYDFSEPQWKDVCDRILCPMKSAIRQYCCEGNDVLSAKDMRTALSERPVRGTIACVCLVNEIQKTLEENKMDGFSIITLYLN